MLPAQGALASVRAEDETSDSAPDVRLRWPGRAPPSPPADVPLAPRWRGVGPGPASAHVIAAEALDAADALCARGLAGRFDVVHLDPPFGSARAYARRREVRIGDGVTDLILPAYTDQLDLPAWLDLLEPLIDRAHRLLAPHGSVFVHLDPRRAPYARMLLDERFGRGAFINEIVWAYGLGGSAPGRLARKHDVIAHYARDPAQLHHDAPRELATSKRLRGKTKRATDTWEQAEGGFAREPMDSVVRKTLSNSAAERTGYPTQKPLALALRMIAMASRPGGLVFDPMAGSGPWLQAAVSLGRVPWLADRSAQALDVMRGRACRLGARLELLAVDGGPRQRMDTFDPRPTALRGPVADLEPVRRAGPGWRVSMRPFALPSADGQLDAPVARALAEDARGLLSAWGVVRAGRAGLEALVWQDAGDQRRAPDLPDEQTFDAAETRELRWCGVDVWGRWWSAPLRSPGAPRS